MGKLVIGSAEDAVAQAHDTKVYTLWLSEKAAKGFQAPGWQELQPHRDGAVLFINRAREQRLLRASCRSRP